MYFQVFLPLYVYAYVSNAIECNSSDCAHKPSEKATYNKSLVKKWKNISS